MNIALQMPRLLPSILVLHESRLPNYATQGSPNGGPGPDTLSQSEGAQCPFLGANMVAGIRCEGTAKNPLGPFHPILGHPSICELDLADSLFPLHSPSFTLQLPSRRLTSLSGENGLLTHLERIV